MSPDGFFDDFPDDGDGPDDTETLEAYVDEVLAAVEAFKIPIPGDLV